jgi:hypothetical protein
LVNKGKGSLYKRKDNQYFLHLPKSFVEDTMFPLPVKDSMKVEVSFHVGDDFFTIKKVEKEN